jgi:hypothetical protein
VGEGATKKIAKREAAAKMVTRLQSLSQEEKDSLKVRYVFPSGFRYCTVHAVLGTYRIVLPFRLLVRYFTEVLIFGSHCLCLAFLCASLYRG